MLIFKESHEYFRLGISENLNLIVNGNLRKIGGRILKDVPENSYFIGGNLAKSEGSYVVLPWHGSVENNVKMIKVRFATRSCRVHEKRVPQMQNLVKLSILEKKKKTFYLEYLGIWGE